MASFVLRYLPFPSSVQYFQILDVSVVVMEISTSEIFELVELFLLDFCNLPTLFIPGLSNTRDVSEEPIRFVQYQLYLPVI